MTDCTSPGGDADATGSGSCSINRRLGGGGNGGAVPVVVLLAGLAAVTVVVVVTTRSDAVASWKRLLREGGNRHAAVAVRVSPSSTQSTNMTLKHTHTC